MSRWAVLSLFLAGCGGSVPVPVPGTGTLVQRTPRVSFEGNHAVPTVDLLAVMFVDKADTKETRGVSNKDLLERDVLLLNALYYDRGFISAKLDEPRVEPADDGPFIDIRIRIEEGPRFRIGKLTIAERDAAGKDVEPLGGKAKLRGRITLRDGDWFARDVLVRDLSAIRTLYHDAGYGDVEVDPETELDLSHAIVDIAMPIHRNALITIGKVVITGNKKVTTDAIKKELRIAEGALYNETKLVDSKKRLVALGLFDRVDVSTEQKPSATQWTVTFELDEK